jgi:membrane protein
MRRFSWFDLRTFCALTLSRWRDLDPELLAAGLSYFALFSLAPLLLVIITVTRQIISKPAAQQLIMDRASLWMSDEAMDSIQGWINAPPPHHPHQAAVIGLIIAAVAGSQVLGYMKRSLNRIWDCRAVKKESAWKSWASAWVVNLLMLAALGTFLMCSLILDTLAGVVWKFFRDVLPAHILYSASWLQGINFAVSLFCFCLLFALIYRLVPDTPMMWEDVWASALVTSLLLAIGKVCVSIYVNFAAFASGYGAASSVLVVLLSIYIGANIFIFGAVFTRTYAEVYGSRRHLHKKS